MVWKKLSFQTENLQASIMWSKKIQNKMTIMKFKNQSKRKMLRATRGGEMTKRIRNQNNMTSQYQYWKPEDIEGIASTF